MKKFIALMTALSLMLSFAACSKDDQTGTETTYEEQINQDELADLENELFGNPESPSEGTTPDKEEAVTNAPNETVTNAADETVTNNTSETVTNSSTEAITNGSSETATNIVSTTKAPVATTPSTTSSVLSSNPADWSKDQIVKYYKYAAAKSSNVTSKKTMIMNDLSVNGGDGVLATFVEMAMPILKKALADNSTEFKGITGGYGKLVPSDVKTAKAYQSGNYTVIEMTLVEQVDGVHGQEKEGTVGHAISVVGDLAIIEEKLPMFDIDFENSDIKIRYANPTVKVRINSKTHQIEKGTWSYDVQVDLSNLFIQNKKIAAFKADIKSGNGSVAFDVTVGGGF